MMLGAGPAASAVRRLLRLRDQDAQAVGMLKSQMAVREERLRLSRDMHDTITKNLHGLSLLAGGLTRCLDRGRLEQARDTAELVGLTARQLADSSRSVILDLRERPDPDLARALQDVVRTALAGHDMMLSWRMSDEVADRARTLGTEASSEILAVVGEAVHNVVKHAAAQSLVVGGELEGDTLVVCVRDDGVGLCPDSAAAAAAAGHLGLVGMAERMRRIGGIVTASAAPAAGTTVTIRVPLPHRGTRASDVAVARPLGSTAIEGMAHG